MALLSVTFPSSWWSCPLLLILLLLLCGYPQHGRRTASALTPPDLPSLFVHHNHHSEVDHSALFWLRATASALTSYGTFVAWCDRPRGGPVADSKIKVRTSTVPGAGLGLFAAEDLPRGTVLGSYPGVVVPLEQHARSAKMTDPEASRRCQAYVWRFSDDRMVIDPTNHATGVLDDVCRGGNPSQFGSVWLFERTPMSGLLYGGGVSTSLCRINEPPRGGDVNVRTIEDLVRRTVTMELERDVVAGEEFFIDYGLTYDRSGYGGEEKMRNSEAS